MRLRYLLSVDYQAVVRHLLEKTPLPQLPDDVTEIEVRGGFYFEHFRSILADHAEGLMSYEPFNEDSELTGILFKEYTNLGYGTMEGISVSDVPGTVVREGGECYILPLVKIEVEF